MQRKAPGRMEFFFSVPFRQVLRTQDEGLWFGRGEESDFLHYLAQRPLREG